jgi:D-alanyl-D-alanine carboxypeptidase (penicillin-binding protein 5/6)
VEGPVFERAPAVSAPSYLVFDDTAGVTLAVRAPGARRPMASTTKIMTALLALERGDATTPVTVSDAASAVGEAEIGLEPGESFPLGLLVRVLLVRSANDAAMAVAEAIGGTVEGFVGLMNQRAAELGLTDTRFANPHGLDATGHYSSAADLLALARFAMDDPAFADAVRTQRVELPPDSQGNPRLAETTNALLAEYPGAIGVKTGYTDDAGLVLVAAAEREGRRLYAVVMGSSGPEGSFRDAGALLDYGFADTGPVVALAAGDLPRRPADAATTAAGRAEALVHLAAAGLLGTPPAATVAAAAPGPPAAAAPSAPLPGLEEAVAWFGRYWSWLVDRG